MSAVARVGRGVSMQRCVRAVALLGQPSSSSRFTFGAPRLAPSLGSRGRANNKHVETQTRAVPVRVVTDIDDTVKSSGGLRLLNIPLGGIDTQYPRGSFYPGVFQFSYELSYFANLRAPVFGYGSVSATGRRNITPPDVAVLTARAREFKFALALKEDDPVCKKYRAVGKKYAHPTWGIGENYVFYGSVLEWIFQDRKGRRKFDNFRLLVEKDCEAMDYMLVGDTGEQDEEAAERIVQEYPDKVRIVFMHFVADSSDERLSLPSDRIFGGVPFMYFRTYVGAALKAAVYGHMSASGLQRVVSAAQEDLEGFLGPNPNFSPRAQTCSRWSDLQKDVADAQALLRATSIPGSLTLLSFVKKSQAAFSSSYISSPAAFKQPRAKSLVNA